MPTLPDSVIALLPPSDKRAPALALADGGWIVAGAHAFARIDEGGVIEAGMWYETQAARWEGKSRQFTLKWVDPAREPVAVVTGGEDPAAFMAAVRERIERTMVVLKSGEAPNGTTVVAQVRRGANGGLFSVLTADGPLGEADRVFAERMERDVREGVGLD